MPEAGPIGPSYSAFMRRDYELCAQLSSQLLASLDQRPLLELDPIYLNIISLERLGLWDEAFERAKEVYDRLPSLWERRLMMLCLGRGNLEEMLAEIGQQPDQATAKKLWQVHYCVGASLVSRHKWGMARQFFQSMLNSAVTPVQCIEITMMVVDYNYLVHGSSLSDYDKELVELNLRCAAATEPDERLELAQQALKVARRDVGKQHPAYLASLNNLAAAWVLLGELITAEPLFRELLAAQRQACGEDDPEVAHTLELLAALYTRLGDHQRARECQQPMHKAEPSPARVNLGPTASSKPLNEFSLAALAELHAQTYQVLRGLAKGSKPQAEAFKTWLSGWEVPAAEILSLTQRFTEAGEVRLDTPTGQIHWLEFEQSPYRFVVLAGENGYRIPRGQGPVPQMTDFVPNDQTLVSLHRPNTTPQTSISPIQEALYQLAVGFHNAAIDFLDGDESDLGKLKEHYEQMMALLISGESELRALPLNWSALEGWVGLASIARRRRIDTRLQAHACIYVGYFLVDLLRPLEAESFKSRDVARMLEGLTRITENTAYDVFEVGPEVLGLARELYKAVKLAHVGARGRWSSQLAQELDGWLESAASIDDDLLDPGDRGRRCSHYLVQMAQRLKSIQDSDFSGG